MIIGQGKRSPSPFLYLYTLCSNVGLLLHLQYHHVNLWDENLLKMWVKSKFVLWQLGYYNLLTEKKEKKIHVFEVLIFLKTSCYCQSQVFSLNTVFRWYTLEKFYVVIFNYFSGRPNKVKEDVLKYFWLTTVLVILKINKSLVSIEKFLY